MSTRAARGGVATLITALLMTLTLITPQDALAGHTDCQISIQGPFLYVDMVFPVTEIRCESVKQAIRVDATLDMDGTQVAAASRTCRAASRCILALASDGIFTIDIPGDQQWCGSVAGSVSAKGPRHHLPSARSCETDSF